MNCKTIEDRLREQQTTHGYVLTLDALAAVEQARREERERIAHADAVAAVWIVAFLDDHDSGALRAAAHPLALVRGALAGETKPAQLGVPDDARWEAALGAARRGTDPLEAIRALEGGES